MRLRHRPAEPHHPYTHYADTAFTVVDPHAVGHTTGDLLTVTNATGKITTFSQYNKHGQPLQSSDPDGVVMANSYDPAGQLLQVPAPDAAGSATSTTPRTGMTATKDNLGNRIEYTLDNAGNRTAETVKDPSGVLRRQLARSIDALGAFNKRQAGNSLYE